MIENETAKTRGNMGAKNHETDETMKAAAHGIADRLIPFKQVLIERGFSTETAERLCAITFENTFRS